MCLSFYSHPRDHTPLEGPSDQTGSGIIHLEGKWDRVGRDIIPRGTTKRAVRIILECFLATILSSLQYVQSTIHVL